MHPSRRTFLKSLSALPVAIGLRSFAASGTSSSTLTLSFSGPLAFVISGNDVIVYAPQLPNHFGRAGTNDGKVLLPASVDYQLNGLPDPAGETQMTLPPLTLRAPKTPRAPQTFSLRVKRPDLISGIRPVEAFLSNDPDRKQTLPTGLRFLYKNMSPDTALRLSASDGFDFTPGFTADKAVDRAQLNMSIEFETSIPDHCYAEAQASFEKLLKLFPGHGITSIQFAMRDPSCMTHTASAHLMPTIYRPDHDTPHKLDIAGGPANCQAPPILIR
jgi:hypothetical protein